MGTDRPISASRTGSGGHAPVRWAVNPHQHGDHTYGNSLLPDITVLIGHEAMRAGLAEDDAITGCPLWSPLPGWSAVTKRVPDGVHGLGRWCAAVAGLAGGLRTRARRARALPGDRPRRSGVLAAHECYYRLLRNAVRDGLGPLKAAEQTDLGEFAEWPDHYGTTSTCRPRFTDTIAWHGGPMATNV